MSDSIRAKAADGEHGEADSERGDEQDKYAPEVRVQALSGPSRSSSDQEPSSAGTDVGRDRRLVGQRSLKVTSDTYTHVLVDGRELD